jgi:hypothetical protein
VTTFAAGWTTLLETASLEVKAPAICGVEVDTDHLPSDVRAAPAWTTVRTAVLMAAVAGCESITTLPDSIYPTARGNYAKLRFREHPDLGTIAVFDQLQKTRGYIWAPNQQMDDMLLCGNGFCTSACTEQALSGFICQCFLLGDISKADKHLRAPSKSCGHRTCSSKRKRKDVRIFWPNPCASHCSIAALTTSGNARLRWPFPGFEVDCRML